MAKDMADDSTNDRDRAAEYRERAREIRRRAEAISNDAYRQEMLEIAAVLERWAARTDEKAAGREPKRPAPN